MHCTDDNNSSLYYFLLPIRSIPVCTYISVYPYICKYICSDDAGSRGATNMHGLYLSDALWRPEVPHARHGCLRDAPATAYHYGRFWYVFIQMSVCIMS